MFVPVYARAFSIGILYSLFDREYMFAAIQGPFRIHARGRKEKVNSWQLFFTTRYRADSASLMYVSFLSVYMSAVESSNFFTICI